MQRGRERATESEEDWIYVYLREIKHKTYDPKYLLHQLSLLKDQNTLISSIKDQLCPPPDTLAQDEYYSVSKKDPKSAFSFYLKTQSQIQIDDPKSDMNQRLTRIMKQAKQYPSSVIDDIKWLVSEYNNLKRELEEKEKEVARCREENSSIKSMLGSTQPLDQKQKTQINNKAIQLARKQRLLNEQEMSVTIKEKLIVLKEKAIEQETRVLTDIQWMMNQSSARISKVWRQVKELGNIDSEGLSKVCISFQGAVEQLLKLSLKYKRVTNMYQSQLKSFITQLGRVDTVTNNSLSYLLVD